MDVTNGLGLKWKQFFQTLEALDGLNINNQAHVWLLHELFLPTINEEAEQWAATWNCHVVQQRGERHLSPQAMFLKGVIEHGQRTIHLSDTDDIGDIDINEYGIDWQDLENHHIRSHHDTDGAPIEFDHDHDHSPFVLNQPDQLSHVEVPDASCPLNQTQQQEFAHRVQPLLEHTQADMDSRRLLWIDALAIAVDLTQVLT